MIETSFDTVRAILHRNLDESRQIGNGQTDGKSEHRHSRNQRSKMDWMGKFNSDDYYIYYCGQESLRRNGVAIMVNKESKIQYLDAISKMTE